LQHIARDKLYERAFIEKELVYRRGGVTVTLGQAWQTDAKQRQ